MRTDLRDLLALIYARYPARGRCHNITLDDGFLVLNVFLGSDVNDKACWQPIRLDDEADFLLSAEQLFKQLVPLIEQARAEIAPS